VTSEIIDPGHGSQASMILLTGPPNFHNSKEIPKQKLLVKRPFGIFQGYVGGILESWIQLRLKMYQNVQLYHGKESKVYFP